jgi:DNA polymerase (family 10)
MDKRDVARLLQEVALLLELKGENPFKIRAYENASRAIEALEEDLGGRIEAGTLTEVPGIGDHIARNIGELWKTGRMKYYQDLADVIPPGYVDMIRIPGLGAKKVRVLGERGITTLAALKHACEAGAVREIPGFGEQSEKKILKGIALVEAGSGRFRAGDVRPIAEELLGNLRALPYVKAAEVGGSLRRWVETVKDVDLLVASERPAEVTKAFLTMTEGASLIGSGETKTSVRMASGLAVDLRIVAPKEFPFALHYFTGNVAHNIRIRQRAIDRGWSLNEYALSGKKRHPPIADEADLFRAVGLPYIEPELREDRGEIEAAEKDELPDLIALDDVRGILHVHTTASDGRGTLDEMARAAVAWGASYLGISDHSQSLKFVGGLSPVDLKKQGAEIDRWNAKSRKLRILKSSEVDILPDGTLDYPDAVLAHLDFVIASIHTNLGMDADAMTKRIVAALRNKHVSILAHPSGRLLLEREGIKMRLEEVLHVAAEEGVLVEINAHPNRLDLDWREVRAAKAAGVRFAVNPDAHRTEGYDDIRYGIGVARKGWLAKKDVVNTLTVEKALALLRSRR